MSNLYVLAADSSRARLYRAATPRAALEEIEDFVHDEARRPQAELSTSGEGMDSGSKGSGPHRYDPPKDARQVAIETFAQELVERLERARNDGEIEGLVLVAPPHFLGELRRRMRPSLRRLVVEELDKNLVRHSVQDLRQHLRSLR